MDILKIKTNGQWVSIPAIVGPSGTLVVPKTETGTELEIESIEGKPDALSVDFQWTQGDITEISPTSPVTITTAESCTVTVAEAEYEQDFTSYESAGIGKGTWNALTGALSVTEKAITVTADMVTSLASVTTGVWAAVLNLGVTIDTTATNNGILACSHYKIGQNPGIWMRNGTLYLYNFDTDDLSTVKSYVAGLNMVVVVALSTAATYSLTGKNILLASGENTVSVDTGTMTITYGTDAKQYIDDSVEAVEEIANTADTKATTANTKATANAAEIAVLQDKTYKFYTKTASNTGTGAAAASTNINWGFHLDIDENIEKCWSILYNPSFSSDSGNYTATRWKNTAGTPLADGETLTKVSEKTVAKGTAILFENVGLDEFISVSESTYYSTSTTGGLNIKDVKLGCINPSNGTYASYSQHPSGSFTMITYKPIKDDSMLLYGKNITLIGDSITEHNGRANVNHGMWLERWTGCRIQNLGVGGTGFKRTAGTTYYKNRISSVNANADIIGVAASFNDMIYTIGTPNDTVSDDTVCGYANEFFDTLLTSFPTARIVCYSEGPWYNRKPGDTTADSFISAMKTICENKGIVWDDGLYRGCALRPWIEANCEVYYKGESGQYTDVVDNVHPNSAGQKVIARYLQKLFEKVVD